MKTCSRCKAEKPEASFAKSTKYKDGLFTWCKTCVSAYNKRYKVEHNVNVDKKCPYCGWLYPEDQFMKMKKGRGGRATVIMCLPCHEARKNPKATQDRLEQIIAAKKAEIRRNFNPSYKEKN